MKVLITGANGFIGKHLIKCLIDAGYYEVIGVDFKDGDLRKEGVADMLIGNIKPDAVIHLAAQVGIYFNEQDCIHAINSNAIMTLRVAKACTKHGARLIHTSTSEVYGDHAEQLVDEDAPLSGKPTGIYAISKRWSEDAAKEYAPEGLAIIRPSMPYGPGEAVGQGRRAMDNMLWQAYWRMPIIVHRGAVRSWCWIGDVVNGYELILRTGATGAFNIGRDDDERSMLEIARMSCDLAKASYGLIQEVEPPQKKTMIKRLSTEKLRNLGWRSFVDLEDGMPKVFEWVKNFNCNGVRM
jgi:nucleoside-diphosphate-sugar epimerase